jgi:hypothetical protein
LNRVKQGLAEGLALNLEGADVSDKACRVHPPIVR